MRRSSSGLLLAHDLLPERIRHAESRSPKDVIRVLEPLILDPRRERLRHIFAQRLASVTVVFDCPYDPHNGAAVIRSCDAFGVQSLHVIERENRPFLTAVTVTRGAEKWVDVHCHRGPEAPTRTVEALKDRGYELVCAEASGELEPADLASIPKLALILGSERDGVSETLQKACTRRVRVPMRGFVDSLNVSVTAAILLSAATKGRPGDLEACDLERLYARGLYFSRPRADEVLNEQLGPLPRTQVRSSGL
jgi:tRNA (guanosine-2'-O-)-methyltransferase